MKKIPIPEKPVIQPTLEDNCCVFTKNQIHQATSQDYRQFLREAGYADLDNVSELRIAKGLLRIDQRVRGAATRRSVRIIGNDNNYLVNINHTNARKIVESLGGKILTVGLMYKVFIPYIKKLSDQGNTEAQATLNEMVYTRAEWLEDLVKDKKEVCIGTKEKKLSLLNKDGRFDRADINEFGYPTSVKDQGEFYHFHVSGNESAAIRSGGSELVLVLDWEPSVEDDGLGVRVAKFLYNAEIISKIAA